MELDQTNKYLDTEEGECIGNSQVKEYYCQVWQILMT
jgi:hypothetical protein